MIVDNADRWMPLAACLASRDLPWTTDTNHVSPAQMQAMTRVCSACPVRNHCAAYAVEAHITGGFWAGSDRDPLAARQLDCPDTPLRPALPGLSPLRGAA
jgi:hypothetical protein